MLKQVKMITVVSIMSALAACGGDGDGSSQGGSSSSNQNSVVQNNDTISLNTFDIQSNDKSKAIQRIKWSFKNGSSDLIQKTLVGNYTREGLNNNNDSIVLSDGFEGIWTKKDITVANNTVTHRVKSINSNRVEVIKFTFIPIDITGVTAKDGDEYKYTGIITALSHLEKIPDTVGFPKGSVCYITQIDSSIPLFSFDKSESTTKFKSLEKWTEEYKSTYGRQVPTKIESYKVGSYNQYPISRIVYDNEVDKSAVNYNNTIYQADYTPKGVRTANTDGKKEAVNCTEVNDVAADFLEQQIMKYYR